MNKYSFSDYFVEPQGRISKRMLYKSDNVIAFMLNIAKGEVLPAHTHLQTTLLFQILDGKADFIIDTKIVPLGTGELMQVDGQESVQVKNTGDSTLRLFVTISPMGTDAFAKDADV